MTRSTWGATTTTGRATTPPSPWPAKAKPPGHPRGRRSAPGQEEPVAAGQVRQRLAPRESRPLHRGREAGAVAGARLKGEHARGGERQGRARHDPLEVGKAAVGRRQRQTGLEVADLGGRRGG